MWAATLSPSPVCTAAKEHPSREVTRGSSNGSIPAPSTGGLEGFNAPADLNALHVAARRPQGDHSSQEGPGVYRLAGGAKGIRTGGPTSSGAWRHDPSSCTRAMLRRPAESNRCSSAASSFGWDRGFESCFLQRRVLCEPEGELRPDPFPADRPRRAPTEAAP
jgi:hypothetical protein